MQNNPKAITALNFLMGASAAFSSELGALITAMKVNVKPHTVIVRKNASGASSTYPLIDENTKKVDGVSTISDTKLPKNHAVIFDRIAVGFAEGSAIGEEGALDYTSTKAPAVLRNATLLITQNGREVVEVPVADMVKVISPTNNDDYYHDLESLQYLVDDQPMEWVLKFPNGQTFTPAADKQNYIEIRLKGFKTSRKQ